MAISKQARKQIEDKVLQTMNILDPSGINSKEYKRIFASMSDTQLETFIKKIRDDDDEFLRITLIPYRNDLKMNNIKAAAEFLKVPLFEYVAMPFVNPKGELYWTKKPVPVGYLHIKRTCQFGSKKNSMSINTDKRNPVTGQVTGKSKNGRVSDMENIALITLDNAPNIIKEFMHPRADNMKAKFETMNMIKNEGRCSFEEISVNKKDSIALNSLDVYFTSCGIKTNLITDGLLLKRTMENGNKDMTSSYNTKR